jgi:hypothetical protein
MSIGLVVLSERLVLSQCIERLAAALSKLPEIVPGQDAKRPTPARMLGNEHVPQFYRVGIWWSGPRFERTGGIA